MRKIYHPPFFITISLNIIITLFFLFIQLLFLMMILFTQFNQYNKQQQQICFTYKQMSNSMISDSQKDFIMSSIKNGFRADGRSNSETQKYTLKINNLDHLLGSALLSLHSTTQSEIHIYTGIKLKVQKSPLSTTQNSSTPVTLRQRITLQLGCIKKLTQPQQQTRTYLQQYLQTFIVDDYLHQFESLLTIHSAKRHYLTINIEAYILAAPHITYLEHLHLCIKSALQNIQMPMFTVSYNDITDQEVVEVNLVEKQSDTIMEDNRKKAKSSYNGLKKIRVIGVLGGDYVKGMTVEEFQAVESSILVTIDNDERVHSFESVKGTLRVEDIHQIVKFAKC